MTTMTREDIAWQTHDRTLALVIPILGPGRDNGTTTRWGTPEWAFPCPVHEPTSDGLIFSVSSKDEYAPRWWCRKCMPLDGSGMDWREYTGHLRLSFPEEALSLAAQGSAGSSIRHTPTAVPRAARKAPRRKPEPLPTEDEVEAWSDALTSSARALPYLVETRLWSPEDIKLLQIGWHYGRQRFTIPVRDAADALVNVRLWAPNKPGLKWLNWPGSSQPSRVTSSRVLTLGISSAGCGSRPLTTD